MRVRFIGYFFQNPKTGEEPLKLHFRDTNGIEAYAQLPISATIYKLEHIDDLGWLDQIMGTWGDLDLNLSALRWFHVKCPYVKEDCKCPWPEPVGPQSFENKDEKDLPCSFFYLSEDAKEINAKRPCPYIASHFPLYIFPAEPPITNTHNTHLYWYCVHPDENERMERILNGTDNPLYDLVHELRYNHAITAGLSAERKEAQERFEENTGQQKRARTE